MKPNSDSMKENDLVLFGFCKVFISIIAVMILNATSTFPAEFNVLIVDFWSIVSNLWLF